MGSGTVAQRRRRLALCLTALLALTAAASFVHAESRYVGCYRDKFAPGDRDLGGMVALEEAIMTPAFCESVCGARHQYKYFGLQYGSECWCGNSYGRHGEESADKCTKPCDGDATQQCGGELTNSVYEISTAYTPAAAHRDGRPLIGLVMIVKNESHTLPATLLAIKPWIDVYYILDTGSSDGTQDAIRRTLGADKGEVWEEPFIDYGRSRNRALEIAQTTRNLGGPPIFSLMLSADETVHNGEGLRRFCEEHRDKVGPQEEAYYMQMDVGWRFDSARLSRTDKGWRYQGRVHEYLSGPSGRGAPTLRVPSSYIKFKVTDPERRGAREYIILNILQQEVAEKPRDTRSSFYLARTYNVVGNHSAALSEFERRVSLGGWREEVYESLYAMAWQKDALKRPWFEVQQAFLDAHAHSPERAEPLYAVASHYYKARQHSLAFLFASHAATLTYPVGASLWVQADVYSWQCLMIVGMTGLEVHKEKEGARALLRALAKRPGDQAMMQQAVKYRAALGAEWDSIECEVDPTQCKSKQISGGGANGGGGAGASVGDSDSGSSGVLLVHSLVAFLLVSNVVLLVALQRRGKAAPACMPPAMSHAMGLLDGSDKQV